MRAEPMTYIYKSLYNWHQQLWVRNLVVRLFSFWHSSAKPLPQLKPMKLLPPKLWFLARDGQLVVVVNNDALGRDPAVNHVKELRVDYTLDGKPGQADRKSTRLNSSHANISY